MSRRDSIFRARSLVAAGLACAAAPGMAKNPPAQAPQGSPAAAYVDQVGAPSDWRSNADFWVDLTTLVPAGTVTAPVTKVVIADPGNTAEQVLAASSGLEFVVQWGRGNFVRQALGGNANRAEVVQVSPGAVATRKANAGAGNGPELDLFGFEVDPGHSGVRNRSPEGGEGSSAPALTGNIAVQLLEGTQSSSRIVQVGWANSAQQMQAGHGNVAVSVQLGHHNRAESEQSGLRNTSLIVQTGVGNLATVSQ